MDAYALSCHQVGMGLKNAEGQAGAQGLNLRAWQGRGIAPRADERQHPRDLEHSNVVAPLQRHKDIAGKERLLDADPATVLPLVHGPIQGQKRFDLAHLELACYRLLMPGRGVYREPW